MMIGRDQGRPGQGRCWRLIASCRRGSMKSEVAEFIAPPLTFAHGPLEDCDLDIAGDRRQTQPIDFKSV